MKSFRIHPEIRTCDSFAEYIASANICKYDLIVTDGFLYDTYIAPANLECNVIVQDRYGAGEPDSKKVNKLFEIASSYEYNRVIAIGGGTAIDLSKLLTLSKPDSLTNLFLGKEIPRRFASLTVIPTTCGTGSEITNISIVAFPELGTKLGLAKDQIFADEAVLIPELMRKLPYKVFVFSSVDALIHAIESFLSPKATNTSRFFSVEAIKMILSGYIELEQKGKDYRAEIIDRFMMASTYAGIAFSNAGCGLVHAMSYPLSGEYHLPHGEANHQMLLSIMDYYAKNKYNDDFDALYRVFADVFGCGEKESGTKFDALITSLIDRKPLSTYGADEKTVRGFAAQVIKTQQRLLANAYVQADEDAMTEIYKTLL